MPRSWPRRFKNARTVRDTLAATPLERFMLETDCPYLAPVPFRGKRCEPAYVREIGELAAQGLVHPYGQKIFDERDLSKQKLYSNEQASIELPTDYEAQFRAIEEERGVVVRTQSGKSSASRGAPPASGRGSPS